MLLHIYLSKTEINAVFRLFLATFSLTCYNTIYRMGVVADEVTTISTLYPYSGMVRHNETMLESFYDYD